MNKTGFRTPEQIKQEQEDLAFLSALNRIQADKMKALENAPDVPEDLRARNLRLIDKQVGIEKRRRFVHSTLPRAGRMAAACLVVLLIGFSTAVATVESFRVQLWQLVTKPQTRATDITLTPANTIDVPADWTGEYFPSVLPEGWERNQIYVMGNISIFEYRDENAIIFYFDETAGDTWSGSFDTENAEVSTVMVHGKEAIGVYKYYELEDTYVSTVVWNEYDRVFTMMYRGSLEDCVMYAESVVRIK